MGLSPELLLQKVNSNENYVKTFKKLYGEVTVENIALAIAEFEKTLITPNSPFDRYLSGDQNAISTQAKKVTKILKLMAASLVIKVKI